MFRRIFLLRQFDSIARMFDRNGVSTPILEVQTIAGYMTVHSALPQYLPYPRFLLETDLTQTAGLIYAVLLDRATLSQVNRWTDEDGRLYIIFSITGIANTIDRSPMTVKNALNELETTGLIERRHDGFSKPNRIYVKLPDGQDIVRLRDKKLSVNGKESCPTDGQKTVPVTDRNLSPNHLSTNNLSQNNRRGTRDAPARGRYANVLLTESEYQELPAETGELDRLIEELSGYMQSTGR